MTDTEVRSKEIYDELHFDFKELYDAHCERVEASDEESISYPDDPFKNNRAVLLKNDWLLLEFTLRSVSRFLAKKGL